MEFLQIIVQDHMGANYFAKIQFWSLEKREIRFQIESMRSVQLSARYGLEYSFEIDKDIFPEPFRAAAEQTRAYFNQIFPTATVVHDHHKFKDVQ